MICMDIIKKFITDKETYYINIIGTNENLYFETSQICKLLCVKNFKKYINELDDEHKLILNDGKKDVIYFSEVGLFVFLVQCKNKIADEFYKWIRSIINEISNQEMTKIKEKFVELYNSHPDINRNVIDSYNKTIKKYGYNNKLLVLI